MRATLSISSISITALTLAALAGCSTSHVGDHDSGALADASPGEDGGPLERDGGPIEIDSGWCECPAPLPGCMYVGSPCPCSELWCPDAGGTRPCGGFAGFTCAEGELCDFADPHQCGATDESGTCVLRPTTCPGIYDPWCGCDGSTYSNDCVAHAAGVDVLYHGECGAAGCAPEDAHGSGACDAIVGYAWNGMGCTYLSGCSCVGADCGRWSSVEECQAAHGMCPIPL